MPSIHFSSGAQELTAYPSRMAKHWHVENSSTRSRVLKLFVTTRNNATNALASTVSSGVTTGVFGRRGIFSTNRGLEFISGSRRIL